MMQNGSKIILSEMNSEQLKRFCEQIGESKFRAKQIHDWIYIKSASSIEEMTNLSKNFRTKLSEIAVISTSNIKQKQVSTDSTIKYLIEYADGACVETVLMRFDNRENLTACISSQVGCTMGCKFCATGKRGFIRNLSAQEIIEQILIIQRDTKLKVTNIVFMGQGEPFLNYNEILKAIKIFNCEFVISQRRLTISTCGIIPQIKKFANDNNQVKLAISLHAPNHEKRLSIMPVEQKYDIKSLIDALFEYTQITKNRVTIEYTLIKGINDSKEDARDLSNLIFKLKCNINLIVYNPCENDIYERPDKKDIAKFKYILEQSGKKVTIRLERGLDIDAACGQLSGKTV